MEKSFGCIFYLKKKSNDLAKEIDIYLRITVNFDYAELSTKRKCFKSSWNVKDGRAEGITDYAKVSIVISTLFSKKYLKPSGGLWSG